MSVYGVRYGTTYSGGAAAAAGGAAGAFTWRGSATGSAVSLDAAKFIQAMARSVSYSCTIAGVLYPVKAFSTDAQLKDIPAAVALLGGTAAGQATLTIAHSAAPNVSPFRGIVPATPPLPEGAPVTVSVSFWRGQSGVGLPVYTGRVFTGYLDSYKLDAVSDLTVVAQDPSYKCAGTFTMPMVAVDPAAVPSARPGYSSLAPTEAALRQSGIYLTPAPSSTDPKVREAYLLMAVSGYGGNMPEVGSLVSSGSVLSRGPGKFCPDVWRASLSVFKALHVTRTPLGHVWMDGWFTINPGTDFAVLVTAFNQYGLGYPGVTFQFTSGSIAQFVVSGYGGVHFANLTVNAADGQPHYWRGSYHYTDGSITVVLQVDGARSTVTQAAGVSDLQLWDDTNGDDTLAFKGLGLVAVEAFEMWGVPLGDPATPGQDRYTWQPETASVVAASPVRMSVMVGEVGLDCWTTIQRIASAEGALAWFDAAGVFHRETLAVFNQRKAAAPAFAYTQDRIDNLPVSVSGVGKRRSVSAAVAQWLVALSTPAAPVWRADTLLTVQARGTYTLHVDTDVRGLNLYPAVATLTPREQDFQSHYQAVDAATLGDPSAALVSNLTVIPRPTNTGFDFVVTNPNPFVVAFYSPDTDGPYLELQGTRVSQGAPVTVTADSNPGAQDDLQLDDNPWRIDVRSSRRIVRSIAAGVYNSIPELANITVPGDPRRQLAELVSVYAPRIMALPERCLVVSMAMAGDTSSRFTLTLGLRPIGPPAGWLAGIPGRSEAGASTYAPLP